MLRPHSDAARLRTLPIPHSTEMTYLPGYNGSSRSLEQRISSRVLAGRSFSPKQIHYAADTRSPITSLRGERVALATLPSNRRGRARPPRVGYVCGERIVLVISLSNDRYAADTRHSASPRILYETRSRYSTPRVSDLCALLCIGQKRVRTRSLLIRNSDGVASPWYALILPKQTLYTPPKHRTHQRNIANGGR